MKNKNSKISEKQLFYDEYLEEIKKLNDDILNDKPIWGEIKSSSEEVKIIFKDDNDSREETKFNVLKKLSKNENFKKVMNDFAKS